ncbi:hypothetical protein Q7C36_000827 [Tachysurus vachellii]|uniref:Uncharacterized protein n=1 Tax=Tachysurus vachellii TaxID=175792 RepID=A0AA88TJ76_TACVA|nr:uncharacterized protein LOC132851179 isoform X1 [Tachysurus vachellii]KAK2868956.1 hypothetical protein Q7C36_000827 [Tachysurus vachellii]
MAKLLLFFTVIITFIILQGQTKSQATTESTQASSAELTSTYSSTTSPSTVSSTSALSKAHPTSSTSLATSINQTATSSQPHTASPVKITTTVQTSTGSAMKNSSETTAFGSKALVSLTTILSSTKEPRSTAASTGTVNAISHSEITTTDQTYKASAVTNISQTTDLWSKALVSLTTILSSAKEPKSTAASTGEVSANSASGNEKNDNLVMNPGLVAILCIFFIVLALVLVVAIAKIISYRRNSQFERLEDLPMSQQSKKNENAPFARYPPK